MRPRRRISAVEFVKVVLDQTSFEKVVRKKFKKKRVPGKRLAELFRGNDLFYSHFLDEKVRYVHRTPNVCDAWDGRDVLGYDSKEVSGWKEVKT